MIGSEGMEASWSDLLFGSTACNVFVHAHRWCVQIKLHER